MSFVRKKINLDQLINIPTKGEEISMIQISFRTQNSNIKTGSIRNPCQNSQLIHDPLFSKSANPLDLRQKSTIRALFRPNPSIRKAFHSPLLFLSFRSIQLISYLTFSKYLATHCNTAQRNCRPETKRNKAKRNCRLTSSLACYFNFSFSLPN